MATRPIEYPASSAGRVTARRVLVVDDNPDAAEALAMLLNVMGHEAIYALDGSAGMDLARTFAPEFVLLDIGMPGMSGYDVATALRAEGCRARLVALTGFGELSDDTAEFDDHFVKPVDLERLERLLAHDH